MNGARSRSERRKWTRLPLAIPVFVRSRDGKGKEFLEFATSLNVSAGGMLVAIRRTLPAVAQIRLEIPSAPVAAMALLPRAARTLNAKTLRTTPADGYYLLGLKFVRPNPLHDEVCAKQVSLDLRPANLGSEEPVVGIESIEAIVSESRGTGRLAGIVGGKEFPIEQQWIIRQSRNVV